jgi:putative FmdB family regulatory protein
MIYLYRCSRHGDFQVKQSMFDKHKADCPKCHREARRVYTSLSVTWGANCWDFDHDGLGDNMVLRHHEGR